MKRISLLLAMALLLAALALGAQSEALEVLDGLDVLATVDGIDGVDQLPALEDDLALDIALDDADGLLLPDGLDLALDGEALDGAAPADEGSALAGNYSTFTAGDYEYTVDSGLASISKYNGTATTVTLPTSVTFNGTNYRVTKVSRKAFKDSGINILTIPSTINELGDGAFVGCVNLSSVTINGDII